MAYPSTAPSYTTADPNKTLAQDNHTARHNQEEADIVALAAKLGTGASTPATDTVLLGTGAGASAFGKVALASHVDTFSSADLRGRLTDETGTGAAVFGTSPTIVTPTIASFTNAQHDHENAAGGGQLGTGALENLAVTGDKIDFTSMKPHYNALFFADGTVGQVFGAAETTMNFNASDSSGFGITATTGSGAYLTIARAGVYHISFQAACVDVNATSFIVWFEVSTNGGSSYIRFRQYDRIVNDDTGQVYSIIRYLPANARVRVTVYNGAGATRFGAHDNTNDLTRMWTGTCLSVAEIGRSVN